MSRSVFWHDADVDAEDMPYLVSLRRLASHKWDPQSNPVNLWVHLAESDSWVILQYPSRTVRRRRAFLGIGPHHNAVSGRKVSETLKPYKVGKQSSSCLLIWTLPSTSKSVCMRCDTRGVLWPSLSKSEKKIGVGRWTARSRLWDSI